MQDVAAFQEKLFLGYTERLKSGLRELAGCSSFWDDRFGKQADSLRAYLQDEKENLYATFKDSQGWTVFHLVSLIGHDDFGWSKFRGSLFESLLYCHAKLSYSDAEGHTESTCNHCGGQPDRVNLHLKPALAISDATAKVAGGQTALHIAAAQGDASTVECLLDSGLFAVDDKDDQGRTALYIAVARGYTSVVKCLLKSKLFGVDDKHGQGMTALHIALVVGSGSVAEALIKHIPGLKPDAESREALTALVQEQATQGVYHGFSDTMVGLLSQYHDRAWCRPTLQQGRACGAITTGGLADLPDNALAIIMQRLRSKDLVQLDTATMSQIPVFRERRLQMRYGRRWLQLTRRIPRIRGRQQSRKVALVYQQLWQRLQQSSKHSLLQTLMSQICNMNDVAALLVAWLPAHGYWWELKSTQHLCRGDILDPLFSEAVSYPNYQLSESGLRQLQHKVVSALSIGFVGCLDFCGDMQHPDNKAAFPEFAAFGTCDAPFWAANHQLLYLCSLHRLQHFALEAVLARLYSIFSRFCRFDLLLLVHCVAQARENADGAVWSGAQADDILTAFGGLSSGCKSKVDCLSSLEKAEVKQHIRNMVDDWVNLKSIWNDLGRLLNIAMSIFEAIRL
ncbi:hypothetical protein ABBQ38_011443 [Trebouxia sp. C0009 RCD-2024]